MVFAEDRVVRFLLDRLRLHQSEKPTKDDEKPVETINKDTYPRVMECQRSLGRTFAEDLLQFQVEKDGGMSLVPAG